MRRALILTLLMVGNLTAGELDRLPLGDPEMGTATGAVQSGGFFNCLAGREVDFEEMVSEMSGPSVVLLGEEHTSLEQKQLQGRILDAIAEGGGHVVLGMEFFLRSDREALEAWVDGETSDEALLLATGWYDRGSVSFEYQRPVMEAARRHGVPVVGLNVPREIPRTVSRKGLAALSEEQRAEVGEVVTGGSSQHGFLIQRYFGDTVAMMPPPWFDNMYAAQCLWDVVMARSILDNLPENGTLVAVAGSGHVAYGLGIARRIQEELARRGRAPVKIVTFCPVTAPAPDPEGEPHGHPMGGAHGGMGGGSAPALFSRSLADYVGGFAETGGVVAYPGLGLKLEEGEGGAITVSRVWPDSLAEEAGLQKGDIVLALGGWQPESVSSLRMALARLGWGGRLDLRVERGGETLFASALLRPEVVSVERSVAPGFRVSAVEWLDPPGAAAPVCLDGGIGAPEVERALIRDGDGSELVEVRVGGTLMAVHELDPNGLVLRSLYRESLPDGTVEVLLRRDDDGALLDDLRFDRTGSVIAE